MNKNKTTLRFLEDWRSAIVVWPSMCLYVGMLPLLKSIGIVEISWLWASAPVWFPFVAFLTVVGCVSFLALIVEIGFLIVPDKNLDNEKK